MSASPSAPPVDPVPATVTTEVSPSPAAVINTTAPVSSSAAATMQATTQSISDMVLEYAFIFVLLYLFGFPILAFLLDRYQLSMGFVAFIVIVGLLFTPVTALIVLAVVLLYHNPPLRMSAITSSMKVGKKKARRM
jgi:hypothetical protein